MSTATRTAATKELQRREMFAEIKKLCAPDNYTNWFVLAREYAVLLATVALCIGSFEALSSRGASLLWMLPIYVTSIFIIGAWVQNRLGVLIHESSHYLLFKNRILNEIVANLVVAFPLFAAIHNYRAGHWAHHRHVNDPEKDPDLKRLAKHHPREFPLTPWKFVWEYCLLQTLPHKAASYLRGRALYAMVPAKDSRPAKNLTAIPMPLFRVMRVGYYVAAAALLTWFGWWLHFVLLWLVPMITFYPAVLFLREIAHHGNYPDNGDYTNSRVYEGKWLEREIFFPFGERNHVLHHIFPSVPWHKVLQAHEVLMRYPPYRDNVVICDGFLIKGDPDSSHPTVLDVLSKPSHSYLKQDLDEENPNGIRRTTMSHVGSMSDQTESWRGGES